MLRVVGESDAKFEKLETERLPDLLPSGYVPR